MRKPDPVLLCGVVYLAAVFIPLLLGVGDSILPGNHDTKMLIVIVGSGFALLLALLSFGLERPVWPAAAALCVLAATENLEFPMMPFWTIMLLAGWSGWAVLAYIAGFVAAVTLIVHRAVTGKVRVQPRLQFHRCPLVTALRKS